MVLRQVEQAAFAKHGGPDGLEEARLRRISTRTEARKKKRSAREAKVRLRLCDRGIVFCPVTRNLEALSQHTLSEARCLSDKAQTKRACSYRCIGEAMLSVCIWVLGQRLVCAKWRSCSEGSPTVLTSGRPGGEPV